MRRIYRQTWWLITCLFLSFMWLTPTATADTYGSEDHDYTIDITPTITSTTISLDYRINIPEGKTANNYLVQAEVVGVSATNPSDKNTQSGTMAWSDLEQGKEYTIYFRVWIYTDEGDKTIMLQVNDALHYTTVAGGSTDPQVTYKAVLGVSTIGTNTITIPYQFFMVKNGQEIAITDDNKGDITMKVYFAWAGNDTEQEKKALSAPAAAFVCDGLSPATAYDIWPKFYVNGRAVSPTDQNFTLTTLESEPEDPYRNCIQEMRPEGAGATGTPIELTWDNATRRYAFQTVNGKCYAIDAYPTDGSDKISFGAPGNWEACYLVANTGKIALTGNGHWDFNIGAEGTLYVYTEGDVKGALPTHYEFVASTTPAGLITMSDLHAVNYVSGVIVGADLDANGDIVYTIPPYAANIEGAMGMSGHYARADKLYSIGEAADPAKQVHWVPTFYYQIGNDETGHIVGIVDYPTPLPDGFNANVRLNTNIWFQFHDRYSGSFEKDGVTYRRYYFSSAYFTTDRFNPEPVNNIEPASNDIAYVDGTISFLFRTPMAAGGTNQTRSFTYEIKGSKRQAPAISVEQYAQTLGADAIETGRVEPLADHEPGDQGDWGHAAHPQDHATGTDADGNWGVAYEDEPIYWHPGITYALGNNTSEAATADGAPFVMVAKLDDGTTIPADTEAFFDIYELDANGNQKSDTPIATGRLQSVPDEINLYFAKTEQKYKTSADTRLGVVFRYQYTSIRPSNGWSQTKLRSYAVSEDPGIHTGLGEVAASTPEAPVEYYNLQGMKVVNPQGGIFIRRQGNTVTKVFVR